MITLVVAAFAQDAVDAHGMHLGAVDSDPTTPMGAVLPPLHRDDGLHALVLGELAEAPLVVHEGGERVDLVDGLWTLNVAMAYRFGPARVSGSLPLFLADSNGGPVLGDTSLGADAVYTQGPVKQGVAVRLVLPSGSKARHLGSQAGGSSLMWSTRSGKGPLSGGIQTGAWVPFGSSELDRARLVTRAHGAFAVTPDLGLNLETRVEVPFTGSDLCACTPSEALAWAHLRTPSGLGLRAGGAVAITRGATAPVYRAFLGGAWSFGRDRDDGGVSPVVRRIEARPSTVFQGLVDLGVPLEGAPPPAPVERPLTEEDLRGRQEDAGRPSRVIQPAIGGSSASMPGIAAALEGLDLHLGGLPDFPGIGTPGRVPSKSSNDPEDRTESEDPCERVRQRRDEDERRDRLAHSVIPPVFFEADRARLTYEGVVAVQQAAGALLALPDARLRLDAYVQSDAAELYGDVLADRRKDQVLVALHLAGVDVAGRVDIQNLGGSGDELQDHRQARVELTLVVPEGATDEDGEDPDAAACPEEAAPPERRGDDGPLTVATDRRGETKAGELGKVGASAREDGQTVRQIVVYVGPEPSDAALQRAREQAEEIRVTLVGEGVDERRIRIAVVREKAPRGHGDIEVLTKRELVPAERR
ncbi:MAG: hypothetical protein KC656_07585 [Myxococcales bacterium]|nr:hypothetical protein [Myxococcales bacterium]MCB9695063.1 hypothetical protein [Alphaproteobacteria bacterium]